MTVKIDKEATKQNIMDRFDKWIHNQTDDPSESVYIATAGSIGLAMYMRLLSADKAVQEAEAEARDNQSEKTTLRLTALTIIFGSSGMAGFIRDAGLFRAGAIPALKASVKSGPFSFIIASTAELAEMTLFQRHMYYGSFCLALSGWMYWVMKNPEVVTTGIETVGVIATAAADVLEEAVDWMPF